MDVVSDDSHSAQNPQVESAAFNTSSKVSKGKAVTRWASGGQEIGSSKQQSGIAEISLVHSHFFNGFIDDFDKRDVRQA
eukprot:CAMPEP_0196801638 /NCGR_PEP_ID=MMETSP1362-20130617/1403_1 /TAXON_ID=163516 /ORGANISM="Leptocylindrus danicus, Strain CCMP1856" /LENGTH=78 /DNA_ID=CAMNT_0042172693 /DNA_START=31 /DNA_END=267 /DNA_ORIENTATION=+